MGLAADRVFGDNSRHTSALSGKRLTGGEGDGIAEIESRIAEIGRRLATPHRENGARPRWRRPRMRHVQSGSAI